MPGAVTHLKTAYYILNCKIASVSQPEQFYLGSISPDSVNVFGHADKAIRWPAHLRDADLHKWLLNARAMWRQESEKAQDASFLLGYIVHIVTDITWDMYFEKELWQRFDEMLVPVEQRKAERWAELYGYEQLQLDNEWFKFEVYSALEKSRSESVGVLNAKQVALYREDILKLNLPKGHTPKAIDDNMMDRFFKRTAEMLQFVLSEN